MTEVLSQDEIDQLLTAISSGESDTDDFKPVSDTRKIKIYDFKRPDKFSKEQLRTVSNMHETFLWHRPSVEILLCLACHRLATDEGGLPRYNNLSSISALP